MPSNQLVLALQISLNLKLSCLEERSIPSSQPQERNVSLAPVGLGLSADLATLAPRVAAAGSWPRLKEVHFQRQRQIERAQCSLRNLYLRSRYKLGSDRPSLTGTLAFRSKQVPEASKRARLRKTTPARCDCAHRSRLPASPHCRPPGTFRALSESRLRICALEAFVSCLGKPEAGAASAFSRRSRLLGLCKRETVEQREIYHDLN